MEHQIVSIDTIDSIPMSRIWLKWVLPLVAFWVMDSFKLWSVGL